MRSTILAPSLRALHAHLNSSPSAVRGAPLAQGPAEVIASVKAGFEEFKASHNKQLDGFQHAVDDLSARVAALGLGSVGSLEGGELRADDPSYSGIFASYVRGGTDKEDLLKANREGDRAQINAAMSGGVGESGGYLAPSEWDRQVREAQRARSPMRQVSLIVPTSVRGYSTLWNLGGWGSGWVGETAARPATTTPTLRPLEFDHGEIYANPQITQQLLDDADFPIDRFITDGMADMFDIQESIAFVAGNGVNKPRGFLTYVPDGASHERHPGGNLQIVPTGSASELGDPDDFVDFVYSHPAPYRQNARWMMNSFTAAIIAKMKDGDGNYLWRETYVAGQPATLLGYPVTINEDMPNIAPGSFPIAFGDFRRGYVINDRKGVRVLRDPYTNKPFVGFYATKRVGGGVLDPNAIRLMQVSVAGG